jgi:hypothetical protein
MKVALEGLHLMNCLHHNRLEASFQENAENQRRRRKIWCRFLEMTLLTISMISLQTKIQIRACILVSKHEICTQYLYSPIRDQMPPSYRVLKGKKFGMVISKLFGIINKTSLNKEKFCMTGEIFQHTFSSTI